MKIFKLLTLAICLMAFSASAATPKQETKAEKLTMNYALKTYVDAVHYGKLKGLSQIIDDNAKFTMQRGEKLLSQTKEEVLQAMKKQENTEQNCEITQSIVETLPNQVIVKLNMKYETFTRSNFVTLSETSNGWKVSHVATKYE